ncbi:uncharacterized protein LOC130738224 [Lotus japonicus]|uniref:uncharacterized protein LOC130738224 n=1 Tax=Lotus japonicus TaxID=34305 RepID=UPI002582A800|nr:uncharacterized protein LOC130738224 [Lotus japonicus]
MALKVLLNGNFKLCLSPGEGISIRTCFGNFGVTLPVLFRSSAVSRHISVSPSFLRPVVVPLSAGSEVEVRLQVVEDIDADSWSLSVGDPGDLRLSSYMCCLDQEKYEVEGAAEVEDGEFGVDTEAEVDSVSSFLEPSPQRPRGHPKKKKEGKRALLDVPRRPRGRPKKPMAGVAKETLQVLPCDGEVEDARDAGSLGRELMVLPVELSEPYGIMTRARSVVLMGKRLGMVFDCSDDVATYQIAAQINARRYS